MSANDLKPAPGLADRIEDVEQVARGSGKAIQPCNH
jgi:hypothetical protein